MEATGVREFPETGRRGAFIRHALSAAVVDVIVPRLLHATMAEALAANTVSRELCGRAMVYLQARTHYGVCDPDRLGPLPTVWERALGAGDIARLNDLFARLIWAKDGDNDALDHFAREYREIIGPPPPPPPGESGESGQANQGSPTDQTAGRGGAAEAATGAGEGTAGEGAPSLGDALEPRRCQTSGTGSSSSSTRTSNCRSCSSPPPAPNRAGRTGRGPGRPSRTAARPWRRTARRWPTRC